MAVPGGATRRPRKFGGGQKIVAMKAAIPTQRAAPIASQRLGCQGSSFVGAVRFAEQSKANGATVQVVCRRQQALFGRDRADNQVRVIGIRRDEQASGFDSGVRRLHRNLWSGKVRSDQDVKV